MFDNEKDLEFAATNLSQNNSAESTAPSTIINENQEEFNLFGEVAKNVLDDSDNASDYESPFQKAFDATEIHLETGCVYEGQYVGTDTAVVSSTGTQILNMIIRTYWDANHSKDIQISFFFSTNPKSIETSMLRLKDLLKMFDFKLEKSQCGNLETIKRALKPLEGNWIRLTPVIREDSNTGEKYTNYKVLSVLGKDYKIGGGF